MIKIRPEVVETEEEAAFADAAEGEVTFLLMPVSTYRMCSEMAKVEGCTAAQVVENALFEYLHRRKDQTGDTPTKMDPPTPPRPEPDFIFKRRK